MEFRVLQYFLTVAREESVSGAAEFLHLSQPTLSRQLKNLEEELGKQLFIRGSRKITLTEEGMLLRKRAEEIVDLMQKAKEEVSFSDEPISGNIYIGAGESAGNRIFAKAAYELKQDYPDVRFHISSGNSVFVMEQLDKGLIDFGVIYGKVNHSKYDCINAPFKDTFGVLMRKDSELAEKEFITPEDLLDKPLIVSSQEERDHWPTLGMIISDISRLKIAATYTLLFNGSLLAEEGLGYAICFDELNKFKRGQQSVFPSDPAGVRRNSAHYLETVSDAYKSCTKVPGEIAGAEIRTGRGKPPNRIRQN